MSLSNSRQLQKCFSKYVHDIAKRSACAFDHCMRISFATDTGLVREQNEDSFFIGGILTHKFGLSEQGEYCQSGGGTNVLGLFDGMGGEAFGEAASAIAAQTLEKFEARISACTVDDLDSLMREYASKANDAILEMLAERNAESGGSTFTALVVKDGVAYPYYVGDSRIYLYKDGAVTQLSRDQTLAQRLLDGGYISEQYAEHCYESHVLVSFLGADSKHLGIDVQTCEPVKLEKGMTLLMCSDGLSDMCKRSEIEKVLSEPLPDTSLRLVKAALDNGGYDNVTCVTLGCVEK